MKPTKINVFLRLSKKSHPSYEELYNYPPENINFIMTKNLIHYSKKESILRTFRNKIWSTYLRFFPAIAPLNIPECDLIHSTNNLLLLSKQPWVADIESYHGLLGFKNYMENRFYFMKSLKVMLNQEECKKIIAWSNIAKISTLSLLGNKYHDKIEVVYPAHHKISNFKPNYNRKGKIKLIFISRRFEEKGGYETLEIFKKLRQRFDCELTMISLFPSEIYQKYSKDKDIRLIEANIGRKKVSRYLRDSDIFIYPTRIDTFGFVLLEAMAHGLPVVTTDLYAIPEIVKNGITGFTIKTPVKWHNKFGKILWKTDNAYLEAYNRADKKQLIEQFYNKLSLLIKNKSLRIKMGKSGYKEIISGKFSIEKRNNILKKLYLNAIRS